MTAANAKAPDNGTDLREGWVAATLGECVDILDNLRVPVNSEEREGRKGPIPYYGATGQVGWIDNYLFDEELVLLGEDGAPFLDKSKPVAYIISGRSWVNNHAHVLRAFPALTLNLFIKHALDATDFATHVNGTTRLKLTQGAMKAIPIPLPPLAEQKRIVAKVEELPGRVGAARERLARVPALLKRFRQSVLAAACSGQLTEDWRDALDCPESASDLLLLPNEPAIRIGSGRAGRLWGGGEVPDLTNEERRSIPESWAWAKVSQLGPNPEVAVQVGPMSMKSSDFEDSGVPVLNVGCVQWGYFDRSKLDYMPASKAGAFQRYRIRSGDILFTRSGTIGRCAVATDAESGYLMTFHLFRVRSDPRKVLNQYLLYAFQGASHIRRQMEESAIGSTRAGFNTMLLANLDIPLPPLTEQREIVCRVDALFTLADKIEARVQAATARVEKITQAILAKAFRGELVPTEAELARQEGRDYEPASVLLNRIQKQRETESKSNRRSKRQLGQSPRRKG